MPSAIGVSPSEEHQHQVSVSLMSGGRMLLTQIVPAKLALKVFAGTCIITRILAEGEVSTTPTDGYPDL